jgi:hypothetical protein
MWIKTIFGVLVKDGYKWTYNHMWDPKDSRTTAVDSRTGLFLNTRYKKTCEKLY